MNHLRVKMPNFSWLVAEQGVRLAIGFVVMTLVARELGPQRFAAYSYVFALFGLGLPLARFGLTSLIVREASFRPQATGVLMGTGLLISLLLSLLGAVAILGLAPGLSLPAGVDRNLLLWGALFLVATPGEVYQCFLRARERLGLLAGPRIGVALLVGAATLILVLRHEGLVAFTALRSVETVILSLVALLTFLIARESGLRLAIDLAELRRLLKAGLPLMLAGFGMGVLMRIDQVLLGQLSTATQLGNYGVAVRIAEVANFVPIALQSTLYPAVARNFTRDPAQFGSYSQRVFDTYSLAAWPAMIGVMGAAWLLLVPVFGAQYAPAVPMAIVLCASIPFFFLNAAFSLILVVTDRLWVTASLNAVASASNILLNVILIPKYGAIGSAVATVASAAFIALVVPLAVPSLRPSGWTIVRACQPFAAASRLWMTSTR